MLGFLGILSWPRKVVLANIPVIFHFDNSCYLWLLIHAFHNFYYAATIAFGLGIYTLASHVWHCVYNSIQIQLWARAKSTRSPRIHSKVVSHSQTHVVLLTVMFMVFSFFGQFFATWQPKIWVDFCEKNAKVARFWGIFLRNCYF
jgi:hypothetical protein